MTLVSPPVTNHAPAKVNLALHVVGRRPDGYHLLESLVVFADRGDRITVTAAAADHFSLSGLFAGGLSAEGDNLVLRAREALRTAMAGHAMPPVSIHLEKNLPLASGLGGGSSDAAATLRALDRHWGLSAGAGLAGIGAALGADVPMCLNARPLLAGGIGERLEPLPAFPALAMVLVNPGVEVSTPTVFRALTDRENAPLPRLPARPGFETLMDWLGRTRNDLQAPATALAPPIATALDALQGSGAAFARMSGSGATCYGLFATQDAAGAAAATIARTSPGWFVTATRTT